MRQFRITTANLNTPSDNDCVLDPSDPIHAMMPASTLGGLGSTVALEQYVIQQKHWLFFWKWTDASSNSWTSYCKDTFDTLEEAKDHIKYFNGINPSYVVVYKNY